MDCDSDSFIDLHIHSNASDGTLTPGEILRQAERMGLKAVSITDHDTVSGVREALAFGIPQGLEFLTGIEISAAPPSVYDRPGSFHILGYDIRPDHSRLNNALADLRQARENRNPQIVEKLNGLGFEMNLDEVEEEAGGGQAGRPHIARVMMRKGFVRSIDEAFECWIGVSKPAYADKYRIPCREAVRRIIEAGGIPVIAHPGLLKMDTEEAYDRLIAYMKEMGVQGIEVWYPRHDERETALFKRLARKYEMIRTGGTDFHGDVTPGIRMGTGNRPDFRVPYSAYSAIIQRRDF